MRRLIFSITGGFVVCAMLSIAADHVFHIIGVYPPYGQPMFETALLLLALSYRVVFSVLGGYLTAMWAKDQAKKAVWILGTIGSVLWLIGGIAMWEYGPAWYNIGGALTGIPCTLLGAKIDEVRLMGLRHV